MLPPVIDGKQVIKMAVTSSYGPDEFTVKAGVPVRWEVDASRALGCAASLQSPQLGISSRSLKRGMNVIEFTPKKAGTYSFTCSMGMVRGTMRVVS